MLVLNFSKVLMAVLKAINFPTLKTRELRNTVLLLSDLLVQIIFTIYLIPTGLSLLQIS